ncbi:EamA family transporter [Salinirubellus sp. GCM10025818]|uniref:EamA family transporter n=1 Tax=Salinirubellus TaxID=2162630 RepID=UPI0030D03343
MSLAFPGVAAGALLAALAALGWAGQYVFIRLGTRTGSVTGAMLVSLACNVALVVPAVAVLYYPGYGLTLGSVAAFAGAGIAGSVLSRVAQFEATRTIGASRTAPVVSSTALVSALLAVVFLDETLTGPHLAGILLIVGAVAVISRETAREEAPGSLADAGAYLLLPVLAALALGVEPILLKLGFAAGTPTFVGLAVMLSAAAVGYAAFVVARDGLPSRGSLSGVRGDANLRWYLGAGVAGTLALVGYFAALAVAPVVVVVPILQAAPLLVVGLSAVFLPRGLERVTPRLVVAAAAVVVGTVVVSLSG